VEEDSEIALGSSFERRPHVVQPWEMADAEPDASYPRAISSDPQPDAVSAFDLDQRIDG
jgi:hypothetical protein